jgi:hypothetical protein
VLSPNARRLAQEQGAGRQPQGVPTLWAEQGVIAAVTAGAASDGNAKVTVTYRGATQACAYPSWYTPVVGHVVIVGITSQGALTILSHPIGTP